MNRFFQGLRLIVALVSAGLCVERLLGVFAAIRDPGLTNFAETSTSVSWGAPDPDALLRLVLTHLFQALVLGWIAFAFAKTLSSSALASRRATFANGIAIALFACAGTLFVQWSLGLTALSLFGGESPYAVLARTETFAGTAVGIGGVEPDSSRAFKALSARPMATVAFLQLVAFGTPAAQVYGLCGLRRSAPILYRHVSRPFRHSNRQVHTVFGCVGERVPMKNLVHAENGAQLAPGETVNEWFRRLMEERRARNADPVTEPIPDLDLDGGGYTSMFLDDDRHRLIAERENDF